MHDLCIIGGGHACGALIQNLLASNYNGKITVFSEEEYYPYERPPLSKDFLAGESKIDDFLIKLNISDVNFFLNTKIIEVDLLDKLIIDSNNNKYKYKKIVFANGARPKLINSKINKIKYLRNIKDSLHLRRELETATDIVLLGAGYISLEISSTIRKYYENKKITIIDSSKNILSRNANNDLRETIRGYLKENNIILNLETSISELIGNEEIKSVKLENGKKIKCDLLIVAIGVRPNIEIIKKGKIANERGILINEFCMTNIEDVYAIGDITCFKSNYYNCFVREESWNNAQKQAYVLSQNLVGIKTAYKEVPWFWTNQFNQNIQILGEITNYDHRIIRQYEDNKITFIYIKNELLVGSLVINNGKDVSIIRKLIKINSTPNLTEINNIKFNLKGLL